MSNLAIYVAKTTFSWDVKLLQSWSVPLFSNLHKADILRLHSSICFLLYTSVFLKLEFMFMKQYAHNRCEPSIEVSVRRGVGVTVHMTKESKLLQKMLKKSWERGGGGSEWIWTKNWLLLKLQKKVEGVQSRGGVGVRVDANDELKLLWTCKKRRNKKRHDTKCHINWLDHFE